MGVDVQVYVFYGVEGDPEDRGFIDYFYDNDELCDNVLYDGMNGKFIYMGKYLHSIDGYGNDDKPDLFEIPLDTETLESYKKEIIDIFRKHDTDLSNEKFKLMFIRHYH